MSTLAGPLSPLLQAELARADAVDVAATQQLLAGDALFDVPNVGQTLSSAYEYLRNAAEYAEEHLLLQRSIKRFYQRNLFVVHRQAATLGSELVSELILAGYIPNGSLKTTALPTINSLALRYVEAYDHAVPSVSAETAKDWAIACLSSEIEMLLHPHHRYRALLAVAFQEFLSTIDRQSVSQTTDAADYELSLYIALHESLLKSDIDAIRYDICNLYGIAPENADFATVNAQLDRLMNSSLVGDLRRLVQRNAAHLRVLKGMLQDKSDLGTLVADAAQFLVAYRNQTAYEYVQLKRRLDVGLKRSVAFLVVTKVLIGVAVEIPYDLLTRGSIVWLPLIINLLFPPLYIVLLRLTIRLPSAHNAEVLAQQIETALYKGDQRVLVIPRKRPISPSRQVLYTVLFAVPIALLVALLYALSFNVLQMVIFVVFFSTASSLALRLANQVREFEVERPSSGLLRSVIDFLTLPFVAMGQWLSRQYRQFNIVARVLDVVIEMPLKMVVRLLQQWIRFFDEQRDRLS